VVDVVVIGGDDNGHGGIRAQGDDVRISEMATVAGPAGYARLFDRPPPA
jgi:hypothetical protein